MNSMSASNFVKTEEKYYRNFKNLKVAFGELII
jgi:hypothetical protein